MFRKSGPYHQIHITTLTIYVLNDRQTLMLCIIYITIHMEPFKKVGDMLGFELNEQHGLSALIIPNLSG